MIQKIGSITLLIITGLSLALMQFSFSSALPGVGQYINPGLIALVFILFFLGPKSALYFAFVFGIFLDILTYQFFGLYTVALVVAVLAVAFVLHNLLTNKSIYSLAASIIVFTFVYNLFLAISSWVSAGFDTALAVTGAAFWQTITFQALWGLLAVILLFHILISWFTKFNPFFLENKKMM